jgi:hypothetical protein
MSDHFMLAVNLAMVVTGSKEVGPDNAKKLREATNPTTPA